MSRSGSRFDWLVFLALGVMWGSSYLFIKIAVDTITPLTLVALRLGIGVLFLGGVALVARERLPGQPRAYAHLTVMAVLNIVLPFTLITWAELSVDSSLAAILTAAAPLFAIVIAAVALRDEPMTRGRLIGLGVGFLGVFTLSGPAALASGGSAVAVAALVAAAASYAAAAVYARRTLTGLSPTVAAVLQVGIAFAISASLALLLEQPVALAYTGQAVVAVLWLGALGSGLAYLAYFRLIGSWGATRTTAVAYLLPVVGILLGVLVAGEHIDLRIVLGTAMVLGGIALVNGRLSHRSVLRRPTAIPADAAAEAPRDVPAVEATP